LQHLQNLFVFGDHLFKLRQAIGIDISGDLQTMARRKQDADCELIARLATDFKKRELFGKLAADLRRMARDIEAMIVSRTPKAE
jgi:hypothetical protein